MEKMKAVINKVNNQLEAWKKHDALLFQRLVSWFDYAVVQGSFKGMPDIDIHLGLTVEEYAILKQNVVTIRRTIGHNFF